MKGFKIRDIDKGWKNIVRAAKAQAIQNIGVKVGVMGGDSREGEAVTNAEIAMVHEYGSPSQGIPERSFLRASIDLNREKYRAYLRKAIGALLEAAKKGPIDTRGIFERLGLMAAADVKALMRLEGFFTPLKPETIARKGSSKPLIDTGQLLNSVTYELEYGPRKKGG